MDVKYVRTKCNQGTKCHTVGLAKNAGDRMFTCEKFAATKCSKKAGQGWTNNPDTLRSKCHNGRNEDVALSGRFMGAEMLRFIQKT
jgi:hypothetical protein